MHGGAIRARAALPSFGRKWRRARAAVGLPDDLRFNDLRHTGHPLSTRSGATLKDTMVRAGQSSEKAALIYQRSDEERQRDAAAGRAPQGEAHRRYERKAEHFLAFTSIACSLNCYRGLAE